MTTHEFTDAEIQLLSEAIYNYNTNFKIVTRDLVIFQLRSTLILYIAFLEPMAL